MSVDPGTGAAQEEIAGRFDEAHEATKHGEHEDAPDPATGESYAKGQDNRARHVGPRPGQP